MSNIELFYKTRSLKMQSIYKHNETIRKSKTRRIIDCFLFYNEFDIINYRLNVLNDIVDYFVIIEATNTFSGKDKPLFSNNLKELFELYKDKIIHIVVEDTPYKYPNINYANKEQWTNEIHQRNCIKRGLDKLNLLDEDFIIIADVDEIPDPTTLQLIKNNTIPVYINT
jgi:beta-1,4-mannosyl-glycoprotein beta-1,4-N-acetylglucosaminyltransferase